MIFSLIHIGNNTQTSLTNNNTKKSKQWKRTSFRNHILDFLPKTLKKPQNFQIRPSYFLRSLYEKKNLSKFTPFFHLD